MRCPECETELPSDANFCLKCGHSLKERHEPAEAHPTVEAARKRVTALFSDLSGYTAMTSKLDPEEVKEITGLVFDGVREVVAKYEGFIERFAGDGVLALFGIPKAHEDDPIRAVRAATEIHALVESLSPKYESKVGQPLSMHSGINTGLAVTADVDPTRGTHGVTGDAVNVAARLSDLAQAREIVVGPDTHRACRSYFTFETLKPTKVKGKSEPIPIHKVISTTSPRTGVPSGRQISSEMVGRDKELVRLELQVIKAINGEGSVVNVIGEAGIGKSRLIAELKKRDVMKRVALLEGKATSIGKNLSFHPIIDLLKQWARIAEDDSQAVAFAKLEKAIRTVHPEETDEILPFVATLMGMKLTGKHAQRVQGIEGEGLEKLILKNVRELVIKGSELRPTVVIMEDLHWADTTSIELLESLYRLAEKHRIAFINVFRPGYFDADDGAVAKVGERLPVYYLETQIPPLGKSESETLINNMLETKGLPYPLKAEIVDRAGGNPFFIEEVVRSLIDEGAVVRKDGRFEVTEKIEKVAIPPTISDVLMARIDRLEERTRELVKVASVIGRSFFDRIIKDVAKAIEDIDGKLSYLKELQLIRDRIRLQELEYLFKHALVQQTAYESTLLKQRKQLHLKVAESIERVFRDRLHEFYGILALHYNKADNLEKAEEYMVKAGEEALRSSASSEAITYFLQALELYTEKHGEAADPEKLAAFEKNIAVAYFNKVQYLTAVLYFDRVFSRWGRRTTTNRFSIMAKLAYDVLIALFRLHLPWTGRKRIPDRRVNEFFDLALKKDKALGVVNPRRCVTEMIGEFRESFKYDLTKLPIAAGFHLYVGGLFSYAGFLGIAKLVLKHASQIVDENKVPDVTSYEHVTSWYNYLAGNWIDTLEYDQSIFDAATKTGLFWDAAGYTLWHGASKVYQGKFEEARGLLENLVDMEQKYQFRGFSIYSLRNELLVISRSMHQARAEINNSISDAVERGSKPFELQALGWRAVTEVLQKDTVAAKNSLVLAEHIRRGQAFSPPWYVGSSLLGQFMLYLQLLEDSIGGDSRKVISQNSKAAFKSGKKAVKNSATFAAYRAENFRLMGVYFWLVGKQKRALDWFDRSVKESKRLGARPDLYRTYMEVGKRLLQPHSTYSQMNGIGAREYLDEAKKQFRAMDLQWDLEQLDRVRRDR